MGFSMGALVESRGWKMFMAKLYGWGAAVVIIGALFKIQHYPGAGPMLVAGLGTEALIFFFSAFEPLHEELDWTLAYPELSGMAKIEDEMDGAEEKVDTHKSALDKFDAMIENAEISPELFERLGHGLKNLNNTTEQLQEVSSATSATNNYVANFEKASETVLTFANSYGESAEKLNNSASSLSESYVNTAASVSQTGNDLAESYKQMTAKMNEEITSTTDGNKSYGEQLDLMTNNLTALNAAYEVQLQGTQSHLDASKQLYGGLNEMMESLQGSVDDAKIYREQVSQLGQNIKSLNTIYGNMLSAMVNPNA